MNTMTTQRGSTSVTFTGSRVEVRRAIFAMGLSLGKVEYFMESCDGAGPVYDTSREVGHELVDVDGAYAGLMLRTLDGLTATVKTRYVDAA